MPLHCHLQKGYLSPLVFSTEVPRELACQEGITSVGEKYRWCTTERSIDPITRTEKYHSLVYFFTHKMNWSLTPIAVFCTAYLRCNFRCMQEFILITKIWDPLASHLIIKNHFQDSLSYVWVQFSLFGLMWSLRIWIAHKHLSISCPFRM